MSQCYAVPPLERRERPVWQAGLALSGGASRSAARGPNHDTTPAALAAGAGRLRYPGCWRYFLCPLSCYPFLDC